MIEKMYIMPERKDTRVRAVIAPPINGQINQHKPKKAPIIGYIKDLMSIWR